MNKRTDVQIYELAFNKVNYGFWDNSLYTPLQCGADRTNIDVCELKDNTGDNISSKNFYYSETTGTYWMWKNAPRTEFIGQCQYRRRLEFVEDFMFDSVFSKCGIITSKPLFLGRTLRRQMEVCHPQIDIRELENVVYKVAPEFADSFNNVFNYGCSLFFSSSYVMRHSDFDEYCGYLFAVLDEYSKRFGFDDEERLKSYVKNKLRNPSKDLKIKPIEYHMLIGGFIQERLFTSWILKRFTQSEIYYKDFKFMDPEASLKKMVRIAQKAAQ